MGDQRSHAARFHLDVNGVSAGFIKKASGLTIKAEIATHNVVGMTAKKNISTISHEDLKFETGLGTNSKPVVELMKAAMRAEHQRFDGALTVADFDMKAKSRRDFFGALITEIGFPALDGSSKEPAYLSITLKPETIRYAPGGGEVIDAPLDRSTKRWLCSNFRLSLGDLPCARVSKIDAITLKCKTVKDEVGAFREPAVEPTALEIPNVKITFSASDLDPWAEWHKSFVIDGLCSDGDELTGAIEYLAPNGDVLGTLEMSNVGMVSLDYEAVEQNKDSIARAVAEVYVEEMTFNEGG